MSDPDLVRQIERLNINLEQWHIDAADQNRDLTKAVAKGFADVAKVIKEGFTVLEHLIQDRFPNR
jgi:hypothetical protein